MTRPPTGRGRNGLSAAGCLNHGAGHGVPENESQMFRARAHTHARTRTVEYSAIKEDILLFARTWMYPEGIMIREISQTEKVKYCTISLVSGTKKKKNHRNGNQFGGCQRWGDGRENGEGGLKE